MDKKLKEKAMFRIFGMSCLIVILMTVSITFAFDYKYKKVDDFKTLEDFKSIDEFESNYKKYMQDCFDNTGGGTGGIRCAISYDIWDRELNIYYNKLMKILSEKEKVLLKESQLAWIKERDKSKELNSSLIYQKYKDEEGTLYSLLRASDADKMMTPIVKQRALLLKNWYEYIENQKQNR